MTDIEPPDEDEVSFDIESILQLALEVKNAHGFETTVTAEQGGDVILVHDPKAPIN